MLILETNESLAQLRYHSHTLIYPTFRSTQHPFMHLCPLRIRLLTGKHEYLYSIVLYELVFLVEYKRMPKFIITRILKSR
ncbi:hypothetical protein HZS_7134 [Henneguya salminicola]|nr:hypothetical protein HZS_7134 [Henneguya salminicola]